MKLLLLIPLLFLSCSRMPQSPCDCIERKIQLALELENEEDIGLRKELNAVKRHCLSIDTTQGSCDFEIIKDLLIQYETSLWDIGEYVNSDTIPLDPPVIENSGGWIKWYKDKMDSLAAHEDSIATYWNADTNKDSIAKEVIKLRFRLLSLPDSLRPEGFR